MPDIVVDAVDRGSRPEDSITEFKKQLEETKREEEDQWERWDERECL